MQSMFVNSKHDMNSHRISLPLFKYCISYGQTDMLAFVKAKLISSLQVQPNLISLIFDNCYTPSPTPPRIVVNQLEMVMVIR